MSANAARHHISVVKAAGNTQHAVQHHEKGKLPGRSGAHHPRRTRKRHLKQRGKPNSEVVQSFSKALATAWQLQLSSSSSSTMALRKIAVELESQLRLVTVDEHQYKKKFRMIVSALRDPETGLAGGLISGGLRSKQVAQMSSEDLKSPRTRRLETKWKQQSAQQRDLADALHCTEKEGGMKLTPGDFNW